MLEQAEQFLADYWPWGAENSWIMFVFVLVVAVLTVNLLVRSLLWHLAAKAERTETFLDDALIEAAGTPLRLLVWVIGLEFILRVIDQHTLTNFAEFWGPGRKIMAVLLLAWFLVRFVGMAEERILEGRAKRQVDYTTAIAVGKLLRLAVIITAALVVMQSLGYSVSGVLAFGGIGGLAVGFAAKDLLANFFGGLMIFMDRPFKVGDWVRSPDKNIEGTVEHIGWRLTRIRTFDLRPLYVPNSTFNNISVENPSRMHNRRIYEYIGVRFDDADCVHKIVNDVRSMLEHHPDLDMRKTLIVNLDRFGPSSLDFFIYTFTKTTEWVRYHAIKEDVLLKVMDIVLANGAEVAFPTTTVHLAEPGEGSLPENFKQSSAGMGHVSR